MHRHPQLYPHSLPSLAAQHQLELQSQLDGARMMSPLEEWFREQQRREQQSYHERQLAISRLPPPILDDDSFLRVRLPRPPLAVPMLLERFGDFLIDYGGDQPLTLSRFQQRSYNNQGYMPNGAPASHPNLGQPAPGAVPLLPNQGRVIQSGPIRVLCIADVRGKVVPKPR